jgi:hypothetical protein
MFGSSLGLGFPHLGLDFPQRIREYHGLQKMGDTVFPALPHSSPL